MRVLGRSVTCLAAAAMTASLLTGPQAAAESQVAKDGARDVLKLFFGDGTVAAQRRNRAHDVVRSSAAYGHRKLVLTLDVRRLARRGYIASWYLRTPTGRWWVHHDRQQGASYTSLFAHAGPEVLDCDGLRGRADRRADRVRVTVPRACIGSPAWVRFGSSMGKETDDWVVLDDGRLESGFLADRCKTGARVRYG